jgi:hypothetical protein
MKKLEKFAPHLYAIFGFIVIAIIYFYPVLAGKQLMQSDIALYTGMAKEQNDFRNEFHEEPYWTNSAFGGMPTYQLGAKYPHNYIKSLDSALRFLPRPADYLFLYFLGFYLLLMSLKIKPLQAFFGALAFGFSTYLIIILGVGHNAKAHAIAYIPMVLTGIIFVFSKRYLLGGIVTMLAAGLEIQANHFQMTYYFLFLFAFVIGFYIYEFVKEKDFKHLYKSFAILGLGAILAIGANATNLLATAEYAKYSTRSNSNLTFDENGKKKTDTNAMSYDYITQYSYGVAESLNLIAPKLFGSGGDKFDKDSKLVKYAIENGVPESEAIYVVNNQASTYWGDQPGVSAPAYIGIIVFFLGILALFIENRKIKYALLSGILFSLFLSFGKNFNGLTQFFIDYVPLYNKFRAVSSIQVILELCFPTLAILGLHSFFTIEDEEKRKKSLYYSFGITAGLLILIYVLGISYFKFYNDGESKIEKLVLDLIVEDRKSMYFSSVYRAFGLLLLAFGTMFLFLKNSFSQFTTVLLVGIVMVLDLFVVAKNYVKSDDFVSKSQIERPFGEPTEADAIILEDTTHFRVFDVDGNINSSRASFFHQSIGGYSAVKPKKFQEVFDYQIAKNNMEVWNMLNTKYILKTNEEGNPQKIDNPNANGSAWFVSKVKFVNSADEEMKALDKLKTKEEATFMKPALTKGVFNFETGKDSTSTIELTSYKPNHLKYTSNNTKNGFGVFSEMYYEKGWKANIDGKDAEILNVNYVLRGLEIPAGKHKIEFIFEPDVVKTGSTIALISTLLMLIAIGLGLFYWRKQNHKLAEIK